MNPPPKQCSLRTRLLRLLIIPLLLGLAIIGLVSYKGAYHETEEVYDAQLVHFARVLHKLMQHEIVENDLDIKRIDTLNATSLHSYEKHFAYRVWLNDNLVLYTDNTDEFGPRTQTGGFTERMIRNTRWRIFVYNQDNVHVEVAEEYEVRMDLIRHVLSGIFLPQLVLVPLLVVIIWLGVRQGVRPLEQLSTLINQRNPDTLEPIEWPILPKEVVPVTKAVNNLMLRMKGVLEKEKHFSNYAAHELRTPLAALKTQIQVALRESDLQKQKTLFAETIDSIDRMHHLVEQLLTFVRVQKVGSEAESVNLSELVAEEMRKIAPYAVRKQVELQSDVTPAVHVNGNPDMLAVMLRNLLDNAIKYTNPQGEVSVVLRNENNTPLICISDTGIGINPEDRERMFDSFTRATNHQQSGSGLGLAIVKWVADQHRISINVFPAQTNQGTTIQLLFNSQRLS